MDLIDNLHSNLIFYPSKEFFSSPAEAGVDFEEIFIETEDSEKLHGYFLPAKNKTNNIMIYFHGNADNVSAWHEAPVEIQKHVSVNALIVDYRGYGKSTGKPTIQGVIKDAYAMYKYLIERGFKPNDISLYGRSLGGAIALELAIQEKVKSIVVQSSFSSLKDIAHDLYPMLPGLIIKNRFLNSKHLIKKINIPILISHGSLDEVVPVSHSYKLFELANKPKKLLILEGAMHNDISSYFNSEYFEALKDLFL